MVVAGGYLLLTRVTVASGGWYFYGYNAFGLSLIPLLVGIGVLFFNGRSVPGWALTTIGALIVVVGILSNLNICLPPELAVRHVDDFRADCRGPRPRRPLAAR